MTELTDPQWWRICSGGAGQQRYLVDFEFKPEELPKSFVYCRKYGLVPVEYGHHTLVMSILAEFESLLTLEELPEELQAWGMRADYQAQAFLARMPGACYRSNVIEGNKTLYIGKGGEGLNSFEEKVFYQLQRSEISVRFLKTGGVK